MLLRNGLDSNSQPYQVHVHCHLLCNNSSICFVDVINKYTFVGEETAGVMNLLISWTRYGS